MERKARIVCGVGINDADYQVCSSGRASGRKAWECPYYQTWRHILERGYSHNVRAKHPDYAGVSVHEDWLTFSNFKAWMETQDWEGKQIDKDILVPGNKVYSPDTCVFVSQGLNTFLTNRARLQGIYPVGVYLHKATGKFLTRCCNPFTGKREHLGTFLSPEAAHQAWKRRKHELACQYADMQTDPRVAEALRTRFAPQED